MEPLNPPVLDLRARRRKVFGDSPEALIRARSLEEGWGLPLVVEPALSGLDAYAWAQGSRDWIEQQVLAHGAILFRNFGLSSLEEFHRFVSAASGSPLAYTERSSPRHEVGRNIYTSTDHPADQSIFPHNEHSYKSVFPLRLFFWCQQAAARGGETPVVDCRRVLDRIPAEVRERFAARGGYMYVRNYSEECGLPWPTVFQTSDPEAVNAYCRAHDIVPEWLAGSRLRTRQVRPVMARHPRSNALVWFNHLTFFHISTLEQQTRDALLAQFAEEDLPNQTYYGDGSAVEPEVLDELRRTYLAEKVVFPWQQGDALMIDNMLTAHAREPFSGQRSVLVAMADPVAWRDVRIEG